MINFLQQQEQEQEQEKLNNNKRMICTPEGVRRPVGAVCTNNDEVPRRGVKGGGPPKGVHF